METTNSKAISSLSVYMYFADISIVNSGVREAYAHVYHLVLYGKELTCHKAMDPLVCFNQHASLLDL